MPIRSIFWDVGGVLLSDAWDRVQRQKASRYFELDERELQARHEMIVPAFERGKITLDEYLDQTVFYSERSFTRQAFTEYMLSLSQSVPEVLGFARSLANAGTYFMGTINNESLELNLYRIEKFGLREIFPLFVSSCFVGLRKPEPGIYQLALEITQKAPKDCCFIDDRALNLESAAKLGMHTIEMRTLDQLRNELEKLGVHP